MMGPLGVPWPGGTKPEKHRNAGEAIAWARNWRVDNMVAFDSNPIVEMAVLTELALG